MYPDRVEKLEARIVQGPYGPYEDWDDPVITLLDAPVTVQPLTSTENYDGMSSVVTITGYRLVSAPGHVLDLASHDRIRRVGDTEVLEVDGKPARWGNPLPHTEARLQKYEGMGQ